MMNNKSNGKQTEKIILKILCKTTFVDW